MLAWLLREQKACLYEVFRLQDFVIAFFMPGSTERR
ncbi:hypothetical protein PS2015_218 [Pseudohongiella spirulinae]|uniref:Uncharacterized protein n=1 Tax=Pseudohongiella spirulinae TaxID=1249552 RepID=A0A0S2KA98_9GAMM|nr:hypothetical protein PS2015_218 [Pseudohongiella spirulinae]